MNYVPESSEGNNSSLEQTIEHLPINQKRDLFKLLEIKKACRELNEDISFIPNKYKDYYSKTGGKFPPLTIFSRDGVFWKNSRDQEGVMAFEATRGFITPITVLELRTLLFELKVPVDQFLRDDLSSYQYYKKHSQEKPSEFNESWLRTAKERANNALPLDQKMEELRKSGVPNRTTKDIKTDLVQDTEQVIDKILSILESNRWPGGSPKNHLPLDLNEKTYYLDRVRQVAEACGINLNERFKSIDQKYMEEVIEIAKDTKANGWPAYNISGLKTTPDTIMQLIDLIFDRAQKYGIDLSFFRETAADSINYTIAELRDWNVDDDYAYVLYQTILNRAKIAEFNKRETELLLARIKPIMNLHESARARHSRPFWKRFGI